MIFAKEIILLRGTVKGRGGKSDQEEDHAESSVEFRVVSFTSYGLDMRIVEVTAIVVVW